MCLRSPTLSKRIRGALHAILALTRQGSRCAMLLALATGDDEWVIQIERRLVGDAGARFGEALAVGDTDSDGWPELFVGAPGSDGGRGAVHVIDGKTLEVRTILKGEHPEDRLGAALAAPDWDSDGAADLAVGAPGWRDGRGAVYMAVKLRKQKPTWTRITEGERPGDSLAHSLAAAAGKGRNREVNGIAVGIPGCSPPIGQDAGRAVVLVRGSGRKLVEERFRIDGQASGERLGQYVGLRLTSSHEFTWDTLVGAPHASGPAGQEAGRLLVLDGRDGKVRHEFFGQRSHDRVGLSAAGVVLHGAGMQYDELLVAHARGADLYAGRDGKPRQGVDASGSKGVHHVAAAGRIGTDVAFGFALAFLPEADGDRPGSLLFYSGESAEPIARLQRPASDECGRAMVSWRWDGAPTAKFIVGSPGADQGAGAVDILVLKRKER